MIIFIRDDVLPYGNEILLFLPPLRVLLILKIFSRL